MEFPQGSQEIFLKNWKKSLGIYFYRFKIYKKYHLSNIDGPCRATQVRSIFQKIKILKIFLVVPRAPQEIFLKNWKKCLGIYFYRFKIYKKYHLSNIDGPCRATQVRSIFQKIKILKIFWVVPRAPRNFLEKLKKRLGVYFYRF